MDNSIWDIIESDFTERRFGEILDEMEKPPADATMEEKIANMARICYLYGFSDGTQVINRLHESQ